LHTSAAFVDSLWQIFGPILAGVPLLAVLEPFTGDSASLVDVLRRHGVTHFVGVPSLLAAVARCLEAASETGWGVIDVD
jgi:non-ribosomal peptide synthetase component F